MTITQDNQVYGDAYCQVYAEIDDKNTTNESRWRCTRIRGANSHPTLFYRVQIKSYPDQTVLYQQDLPPQTDAWYGVPAQFQTDSPWNYSWAAFALQ